MLLSALFIVVDSLSEEEEEEEEEEGEGVVFV
jgi:hypothetical protein